MSRAWAKAWWSIPLLVGALMCRSHPGFGLVGDARFLILENRFIVGFGQLWPNLVHDYFWSSSGNAIPYFRPFTKGSWVIEATLFGTSSRVFQLVQIAWFLVAIGGVMRLAREAGLQRRWALVAGAVFAAHPATAEPVALVMARSDVVSVACALWALAMHRAHLRTGSPRALAAHLAFLVAALASKEVAFAVVPIATAWALLDRKRRGLWPMWVVAAAFFVARKLVLGPMGTTPLAFDPLRLFAGMGASLSALAHLGPTTGLRSLSRAEASSVGTLVVSGLAFATLALVVACHRWDKTTPMLVLWMLASLSLVLLPRTMWVPGAAGKIALSDRWLLGALAAGAIVVARLGQRFVRGRVAWIGWTALSGWLLLSIAFASEVRADYRSDDTMLALEERAYQETPEEFRTPEDRCLASTRVVAAALARNNAALAISADDARPPTCVRTTADDLNRLSALVHLTRWAEARRVADALLLRKDFEPRQRGVTALLSGIAALETGDAGKAEERFGEAARFGSSSCQLPFHSARAAMALGHPLDAARRLEAAYDCQARSGRADPQLLLGAASLLEASENPAEAARVRARVK